MRKLIFLHASWCGPCKHLIRALLPKIEQECPDQVESVDVSEDPQNYVRKFKVKRVPTFLLMEDGKLVKKVSGSPGLAVIDWLKGGDGNGADC